VQRTIRHASRASLPSLVKAVFALFLDAFDLCNDPVHPNVTESLILPAFLDMVEKLNEATFKPLFGRMYDWAAIRSDSEPQGESRRVARRATFRAYISLFCRRSGPVQAQDRVV
jgi:U3 small nucleolar RNA-associated protein 10